MRFYGKKCMAMLLCFAVLLSLSVGAVAVSMTQVYCQAPEDWDDCMVYWWGGSGKNPKWPGVNMQQVEGSVWGYSVPSDAQGIIFTNGDGQKTADLKVPRDDKVMYLFEGYYWTQYGQMVPQKLYTVAGFRSLCGSDWDPSDMGNQMLDLDGDGIYTKTYENVAAGTYELKVTVGSWSQNWGNPETGGNYILNVARDNTTVTVCFDTAAERISISLNGQPPEQPEPTYTLRGSIYGVSGNVKVELEGKVSKTVTAADTYAFEGLTAGDYQLVFSKQGYVTRSYELTLTESTTLDASLNRLGDLTGDGKINVADVARLYTHIRGVILLNGYILECADYHSDGRVNLADTAKLYAEVRQEPAEPVTGVYVVGRDKLPYTDEEIYQQLFDPNTKLELDLDMSHKELQKLQKDYEHYRDMGSKSPIYRLGTLTITVTTEKGTVSYVIEEVGARMKGNTSRTSFYNEEEGIYKYIHFKLDFQETFDDEQYYGSDSKVWESDEARQARKDRTFATLEKLELRWNKLYDATYLRESYAYEIFRSEGVLAPQCNIGALTWSGALMGIYTVEEPVDQVFIERNVAPEDQGGDLYKLGWTNEGATFTNTNSIGVEDEDKAAFYIYDLKTNKKKSTHEALKNLINTLNSGKVTKESYASVVDVDSFLKFAAVSYFMGNPDDLRNNYNNCYAYFLKSSGKAVFIPYDFDRCLGINREWNPSGHSHTRDNPYGEGNQRNPLFRYSVDEGGFYTAEYTQVLLQVAENELLTAQSFARRFDIAQGLYADLVNPERNLKNAEGRDFAFDLNRTDAASGGSNMSFWDYMDAKMAAFRNHVGQYDPNHSECYIRGDFNGWSIENAYAMEAQDQLLTIRLSFNHSFKFKVYNHLNGNWMGSECISPETTVAYDTDGHTNIVLPAGTYQVAYDLATGLITVSK